MSLDLFEGRWSITVGEGEGSFPSWLEVSADGSGRFVGIWGNSRPVSGITASGSTINFALPPQYEGFPSDLKFSGTINGETITGTTNTKEGGLNPWKANRAPILEREGTPTHGQERSLIGSDLSDWHPRSKERENFWSVVNGELYNAAVGTDLVSNETFHDFKLVAEYSYPKDSNSGIYLRGHYEVQILDDFEVEITDRSSGGIYGFIAPSQKAIRPYGERNLAEITLIGRTLTVVLNGITVIDAQEVPGITGGALNSNEGEPGPILLQGDHGPVTFHRLEISPIEVK